jgi:hypothetical protein
MITILGWRGEFLFCCRNAGEQEALGPIISAGEDKIYLVIHTVETPGHRTSDLTLRLNQ